MSLRDYLEIIKAQVKENPNLLELEVFYAIDEEGNEYRPVQMEPGELLENDVPVYCVN